MTEVVEEIARLETGQRSNRHSPESMLMERITSGDRFSDLLNSSLPNRNRFSGVCRARR
jgi:hypothetical protein